MNSLGNFEEFWGILRRFPTASCKLCDNGIDETVSGAGSLSQWAGLCRPGVSGRREFSPVARGPDSRDYVEALKASMTDEFAGEFSGFFGNFREIPHDPPQIVR
jgi:hypothetical protein